MLPRQAVTIMEVTWIAHAAPIHADPLEPATDLLSRTGISLHEWVNSRTTRLRAPMPYPAALALNLNWQVEFPGRPLGFKEW